MITLADIRGIRTQAAFDKLLAVRFDGNDGAFADALDRAINGLLRSDLKKAQQFVESVEAARRHLPGHLAPRFYAMRGRVCHWTGRYREALTAYRKAWHGYGQQRDLTNRARLGRGLMDVYMYLGRHREALAIGRESLTYFRRKRLTRDAGMVMTNIGNVYHRLDSNRLALHYYDEARKIFAPEGGVPLAIVEYNRANIFSNLSRFDEARKLYESSARLYAEAGMAIAENQAVYSLAYLYFLEDRFSEALQTLERVQDSFTALGDTKSAAVTRLDLCELNLQLNQYGAAIMAAEEIIPEFHRLGMRYEEAKANYFAARARLQLGDHAPAARQLKRAESLFQKEENPLWLGMVQAARCHLYLRQEKHALAGRAVERALGSFSRSHDTRRILDAKTLRVQTLIAAGRTSQAISLARRLLKQKTVSYQRQEIQRLLARALALSGEDAKAADAFASAIGQLEQMLPGLQLDEIRFFFLLDKFSLYREAADCLQRLNRIDEAFSLNLTGLRLANERLPVPVRTSVGRVPPELLDEHRRLRALLRRQSRIKPPEAAARRAGSYGKLEERLWAIDRKIRSYEGRPATVPVLTASRGLDEVRRKLRHDETLLLFSASPAAVGVYIATTEETSFQGLSVSLDDLRILSRKLLFLFEHTVQSHHRASGSGEAVQHYLQELHRHLIAPIEAAIQSPRLILLGDPAVPQIPFALLQDESGRYLMDRYALNLIVSPDDLSDRSSKPVEFASKANAVFAAATSSIPAVELEGQAIQAIFPSARHYGTAESTRENLVDELGRVDGFLHIAAHASCASENPLFSRILLSDGPFFPFDLFVHDIRAELVTLSGCQTAAPGLYFGNSFSLAKSFYQAGSRWVLASQWPVSDKLSMVFMVEFFSQLRRLNDIPQAYAESLRSLREVTPDPALWGGFVLLGLDNRTEAI